MKSVRRLGSEPAGVPLAADDLIEFHAARLLLLVALCGTKSKSEHVIRIEGLTKLAKLDFFVRYPEFFDRVSASLDASERSVTRGVESSMIRHHYGPWDQRYYEVIPFLEGIGMIKVTGNAKNGYAFALSDLGSQAAKKLQADAAFSNQVEQMKRVKKVLGAKNGTTLKNLVYKEFSAEVAERTRGELIQ